MLPITVACQGGRDDLSVARREIPPPAVSGFGSGDLTTGATVEFAYCLFLPRNDIGRCSCASRPRRWCAGGYSRGRANTLSHAASAGFGRSCVSTIPSAAKSGRIEPGGCGYALTSRSVNVN